MPSGELGPRYAHPGTYLDPISGEVRGVTRLFIGHCTIAKGAGVVWFSNERQQDGRWKQRAFLARVEGASIWADDVGRRVATLEAARRAVARGTCREVPGMTLRLDP